MYNHIHKEDGILDFIHNVGFLRTHPYGEDYECEDEDTFVCEDYHRPRFEC